MKTCRECGGELQSAPDVYRYRALPSVTLVGVRRTICGSCGEEYVSIPAMAQLNRLLVRTLVRKPTPLSSDEVRFLRKHVGWSSKDFARAMGVTPETASRWESGARNMSAAAERLLRLLVANSTDVGDFAAFDVLSAIDDGADDEAIRVEADESGWHVAA